jgi:hypothetical protein
MRVTGQSGPGGSAAVISKSSSVGGLGRAQMEKLCSHGTELFMIEGKRAVRWEQGESALPGLRRCKPTQSRRCISFLEVDGTLLVTRRSSETPHWSCCPSLGLYPINNADQRCLALLTSVGVRRLFSRSQSVIFHGFLQIRWHGYRSVKDLRRCKDSLLKPGM